MPHSGRLVIICGLPGAGKTTLARKLAAHLNAIRFCPDEWMVTLAIDLRDEDRRGKIEACQWQLAQQLLTHGLAVIIEWGTWSRAERDTLRKGAHALGAAVELHYLSATVDQLFQRIQCRNRETPPLQRADIQHWFNLFEAPTSDEMNLFDTDITLPTTSG